jgi:hypothetical protein
VRLFEVVFRTIEAFIKVMWLFKENSSGIEVFSKNFTFYLNISEKLKLIQRFLKTISEKLRLFSVM